MNGARTLVSALLVLLLAAGAAGAETATVPAQVQEAAARGLELFKTGAGAQSANAEAAGRVTLGEGFQVHYVDADRLRSASPESLLALVTPQELWEFTVNVDGQAKTFVTIGYEDGEYRIVHFGGNAADFGAAMTNFGQLTAGVQPTLVKAGPVYYLVGRVGTDEVVLPAVASAEAELRPASELVRYLQQVQQNSVPGQRGGHDPAVQDGSMSSPQNRAVLLALGLPLAAIAGAVTVRYRRRLRR